MNTERIPQSTLMLNEEETGNSRKNSQARNQEQKSYTSSNHQQHSPIKCNSSNPNTEENLSFEILIMNIYLPIRALLTMSTTLQRINGYWSGRSGFRLLDPPITVDFCSARQTGTQPNKLWHSTRLGLRQGVLD